MRPLLLIDGFPKYPPSCRSPGSAFQPTVRTACFRLTVRKPIPCVRALLSVSPYSILAYSRSADTPFVLFALLLLSVPDGFTFRSLFAFDGFGERTGVNIDRLPYRIGMLRSIPVLSASVRLPYFSAYLFSSLFRHPCSWRSVSLY